MSYSIGEVIKRVDLPASTLRYYEQERLIPQVSRNEAGNRNYTETDIEWILFVKTLRETDMPIHLIKKYVSLFQEGEHTMQARKRLIGEHTEKVQDEINRKLKNLAVLENKMKYYHVIDRRKQRLSNRAFR